MIRACLASTSGATEWAIIKKPDRLEPHLARQPEMLLGHVGLGAVGGNPDDGHPEIPRGLDVVLGSQSGQHQGGDLGPCCRFDRGPHELAFVDLREAVVEGAAAEPVPVGDLNHRDTRRVQGAHHRTHIRLRELVTLGVRSIPQRGVGDAHVEFVGEGHAQLPTLDSRCRPISSPTRAAAAVMMSRFPA